MEKGDDQSDRAGEIATAVAGVFVVQFIIRRYMAVVLVPLAALFVCGLAGFTAWSATIALRLGKFTNRNGIEISRRENPIIFWLSILLGFVPLAACLFIGLWVAHQFLSPSHG
jgi:hypothetical protein